MAFLHGCGRVASNLRGRALQQRPGAPRGGHQEVVRLNAAASRSLHTLRDMLEQEKCTLEEELEAEAANKAALQPAQSKELDQMHSDLRFKRLAPGWLPLCPERSFFIPPSRPLSALIKNLPTMHRPVVSPDRLRVALNPLGFASAEAIRSHMAVANSSFHSSESDTHAADDHNEDNT